MVRLLSFKKVIQVLVVAVVVFVIIIQINVRRQRSRFYLIEYNIRQQELKEKQKNAGRHKESRLSVAIVTAVTSRGKNITVLNLDTQSVLLTQLTDSFCKTCSSGFTYHLYAGYDYTDYFFQVRANRLFFQLTFDNLVNKTCPKSTTLQLHLIKCNYTHKPSWSQNDAVMEAYLDGADYFYRVNDDSIMLTPGWTEAFIETLGNFVPPNVGVVAPNHIGDSDHVLQYDFIHRTHIDIFGFYGPRYFQDWKQTTWITYVYSGIGHIKKLTAYRLNHTESMGRRYMPLDEHMNRDFFMSVLDKTKTVLYAYLGWFKIPEFTQMSTEIKKGRVFKGVISYSVDSQNKNEVFGIIRNAKLAKVYFKGWVVRLYVRKVIDFPKRILKILTDADVEIIEISQSIASSKVPYIGWKTLVLNDSAIDAYIVHRPTSRLSLQDSFNVKHWLDTNKTLFLNNNPERFRSSLTFGGKKSLLGSEKEKYRWKRLLLKCQTVDDLTYVYQILFDTFISKDTFIPLCDRSRNHCGDDLMFQEFQYYNAISDSYDNHEMKVV